MAGTNEDLSDLTLLEAVDGTIKLITCEGRGLYNTGIGNINNELYDCTPDRLYQFLESLSLKAKYYRWDTKEDIISIQKYTSK